MDLLLKTALAIGVILALLSGWIVVQHLARAFAARHPEMGPAREEGGGCGGLFCLCDHGKDCPRDKLKQAFSRKHPH
jgi:hypothetical protein